MAIVTTSDFIDKFKLTLTDFNTNELSSYIERYETITLIELMGKELFDLYVIGFGLNEPIYVKLHNSFIEQSDCGEVLNSRGLKDLILGTVYFYYSRDILTQRSENGSVAKKGENSSNVTQIQSNVQSRWDEAVDTYCAIQSYIIENHDVYPTFRGLERQKLPLF